MNTTTVGIEPISVSSGYGGTRLVTLGYVPQSASEWDYTLPGSGRAVAHFGPAGGGFQTACAVSGAEPNR